MEDQTLELLLDQTPTLLLTFYLNRRNCCPSINDGIHLSPSYPTYPANPHPRREGHVEPFFLPLVTYLGVGHIPHASNYCLPYPWLLNRDEKGIPPRSLLHYEKEGRRCWSRSRRAVPVSRGVWGKKASKWLYGSSSVQQQGSLIDYSNPTMVLKLFMAVYNPSGSSFFHDLS